MDVLIAFILGACVMYALLRYCQSQVSSTQAPINVEKDRPFEEQNASTSTHFRENASLLGYASSFQKQAEKLAQEVSEMKIQSARDCCYAHPCQPRLENPTYQQIRTKDASSPTNPGKKTCQPRVLDNSFFDDSATFKSGDTLQQSSQSYMDGSSSSRHERNHDPERAPISKSRKLPNACFWNVKVPICRQYVGCVEPPYGFTDIYQAGACVGLLAASAYHDMRQTEQPPLIEPPCAIREPRITRLPLRMPQSTSTITLSPAVSHPTVQSVLMATGVNVTETPPQLIAAQVSVPVKKISMRNTAKESPVAPVQKEPHSLAELLMRDDQWECRVCMASNDESMGKCPACQTPRPSTKPAITASHSFGTQIEMPPESSKPTTCLGARVIATRRTGANEVFVFRGALSAVKDGKKNTPLPTPQVDFTFRLIIPDPNKTSNTSYGYSVTFERASPQVRQSSVAISPRASSGKSIDSKRKLTFCTPDRGGQDKEGFQFSGSDGFKFDIDRGVSQSVSKPQTSAPVDLSVKTPAVNVTSTTEKTTPTLGTGTFTFTPSKANSAPAVTSPQSPGGGYYFNNEGDNELISFESIIHRLEKVDLKTGEEDEEILFMERAKLLRFVGKEWKERGVGEVKLLLHRASSKVRVLMRREKVHKLCLNHAVNESNDLQALPNRKGKAWTWHADDFSDGEEPVHETFAIKFITEEAANRFKAVFDKAKVMKPPAQEKRGSLLEKLLAPSTVGYDSDVEFIKEVKPNATKVEKARVFKLPDTFYNYENKPDCGGCLGCMSPPFDFSKIGYPETYASLVSSQPTSAFLRSSGNGKMRSVIKFTDEDEAEEIGDDVETHHSHFTSTSDTLSSKKKNRRPAEMKHC